MVSKLPDEFFRRRPEESEVADDEAVAAEEPREVEPDPPRIPQEPAVPSKVLLVPTRVALVVVLVALVVGFVGARMLLNRAAPGAQPSPVQSVTVTPSPSPTDRISIYDGPTTAVQPVDASTTCVDDGALRLLEGEASAVWRCEGDGVGERLRFSFESGQKLSGVRIVGGDNTNLERFTSERRILSIRWHFSDGSWFDQGLPSNDATAQEVAFPIVRASGVELEILGSTLPGNPDRDDTDVVTISELRFLAPA